MTTTLDPSAGHLVLINTFTVEPSRAEELLKILSDATEQGMRHLPGFVSANLHMSLDRTHVANYAEWLSQSDLDRMMQNAASQQHMKQAAAVATAIQPLYYQLRESHGSASVGERQP